MPTTYTTPPLMIATPNTDLLLIGGECDANGNRLVTLRLADGVGDSTAASSQVPTVENAILTSAGSSHASRIEVWDLILDGNWTNQGVVTTPVWSGSYKVSGLVLSCTNAAVRRVHVKNFGAKGMVPVHHFAPAATEAFPLLVLTHDWGQQGLDGDPPIVIEDCEVSGFNGLQGGYCTAICIGKAAWTSSGGSRTDLLGVVRRCQVRGMTNGIGMGAVSTKRVLYENNAIINCAYGFNSDTIVLGNIGIQRNVFLDVSTGVKLGGKDVSLYSFTNYNISYNSFRLNGRAPTRLYQSYKTVNWIDQTDSTLDIGRAATRDASAVCLEGATDAIVIQNNDVTTRKLPKFYPYDANAVYRVVRSLDESYSWAGFGPYYRLTNLYTAGQRTGNRVSGLSWDFGGSWTNISTDPDSADRLPIATDPSGNFTPDGTLGRVELLSGGSARELLLGEPATTNWVVTVKARWYTQPASTAIGGTTVRLQVLSGPSTSGFIGSGSTDANGLLTFTYTNASQNPGRDLAVAWVDGAGGTAGQWDVDNDYYAFVERVWPATVSVEAGPDVANDKNIARRGYFTFSRVGDTGSALTVPFRLVTAWDANKTASNTVDYTLWNSGTLNTNWATNGYSGWISIPAGSTSAVLEVRGKYDTKLEYEGVKVNLLATNGFAIGPPGEATVTIWDGPLYTAVGLPGPVSGGTFYAYALNHNTNGPDAVGSETYYPNFYGLKWARSGSSWSYTILNPPASHAGPYPFGIGDGGLIAGRVSSNSVLRACRWPPGGSATVLPCLYGAGPSEALAVSPSGEFIVGYSHNGTTYRAARWTNSAWAIEDLKAFDNIDTGVKSYAYAVNNTNQVVGKSWYTSGGTVFHGFRTSPSASSVQAAHDLWTLPQGGGTTNFSSVANGINGSGAAVGGSDGWMVVAWGEGGSPVYDSRWHACYWPSGSTNAVDLGVLAWNALKSEALGVNDQGTIVGWSYTDSSGANQRAFICEYAGAPMVDLSDPAMVSGASSGSFTSAEGINNRGYIIVNGTYCGTPHAWLLVPNE